MYMTICAAAKKAGLSPGSLRTYERLGLMRPQRDSAGRRVYMEADVALARRIAAERAKRRGFQSLEASA